MYLELDGFGTSTDCPITSKKLAEILVLQADGDQVLITQNDFDGLYEDDMQLSSRSELERLKELETQLFG